MRATDLEPLLHKVERHAIVTVLRAHPEWTIGLMFKHLERAGSRAAVLRELTVGELLSTGDLLSTDGGPPIDRAGLQLAEQLTGDKFDELVDQVIRDARRPVGAAYLRARVGGPRWKLQSTLRRLASAGLIVRTGTTSATRYRSSETTRS